MVCLIVLGSLIVGAATLFYFYVNSIFSYWKNRGVPQIEPTFPWGNLKANGKFQDLKQLLSQMYSAKGTSAFVGGYLFLKPIVLAADLEFVKNVLIKDFNYFEDRGSYSNERDDPLSAHLFSLDGPKWRVLRGKITPTFRGGKIKFMCPTMLEVAGELNLAMNKILQTESCREIKDLLGNYFTDIIGTCIFGIQCNSLTNPNAEFRKMGRKLIDEVRLRPLMRAFTTLFPDTARKFRIKVTLDDVSDFFMGIVRETIDYREKNNIRRNDFMDLLIQLKNNDHLEDDKNNKIGKLSFEEIAAQAFVFFLAGFETSATTMAFTLYELMLDSNIQDKARDEINDVLDKHNGKLTYDALNDMTYLDQLIYETLRKYPPVIFLIRKSVKDYPVPGSTLTIEKGTSVFIPTYSIQHDPEIYPDPEVYDPDRFTPEQMNSRHSSTFLSFGDGPRNCIGLRFGQLQVKIGLATLLKNFKFTRCSKSLVPMEFSKVSPILTPKGGIWLGVERI